MWTDGFIVLNINQSKERGAFFSRVLREHKFQVWEAPTIMDAMHLAADLPDIVLLGGSLTDSDRLTTFRKNAARKFVSPFPILHLIDDGVGSVERTECFDTGADSVLTEPVSPAELIATIRLQLRVRQMEEKLHSDASRQLGTRSESLYQMLVDSIPPSVLLIDESMHVVLANKNFLEKSRRSKADTLGKPLSGVFPAVILEELGLLSQIKEAFENGRALQGRRLTYRAPGVPLRIYYYNVIPISWSSNVERVLLVMEDVTEQLRLGEEIRRVERHLASVVESANEIVLSTNRAGHISTWNSAAERITGYQLKEVQGRPLYDYFSESCHPALKLLFTVIEQRTTFEAIEYDVVTHSGGQIPASWVFSPLKDSTGNAVGIVAVGRDLTERRKFEQQIRQAEKLAALGVMAGGIAHEIRTPLAIASSAAQFLMDPDISDEFGRDCARKIHLGMHRASAIIESLLRFAHPSSTEMTLINLSAVCRDTIVLASNQIRQQQIELVSQLPETPVEIMGIGSLLGQVFLNLILNSLKAMPNGGTLTVVINQLPGQVEVLVSDTGCGIAPADIHQIFDPFYTTAPPGKGTGLGLSISYSIIKQHLGSIEVESVVGKGSTFTVWLPRGQRFE